MTPTTPMSQSIAEIAGRLTKAQRTACLNMTARWDRAPYDGWRRAGQACSSLCRIGLVERSSPGKVFRLEPAYRLTSLGTDLRTHLLAEEERLKQERGGNGI